MSRRPYEEPSEVAAENGKVLVDGPDGVAIALTPDAALETSERLSQAGAEAHGQKIMQDIQRQPPR